MRTWTRWQNWVAVAAGLYAALSPLWTVSNGAATGSLLIIGILIIIAGMIALAMPGLMWMDWAGVVLGILLFISPWVLGYAGDVMGAAWTAWITGGVTIIAEVWAAMTPVGEAAEGGTERTYVGRRHHRPIAH